MSSTPLVPLHGTGVALKAVRQEAKELSSEEFEDKHGQMFLLLSAAELNQPTGPMSTDVKVIGLDEPVSERTASLSLVVYPLKRTGRSVGHLITVGRTANNDVVVPDISVSRFHAFVKEGENSPVAIQDASSTNGTSINGTSVPAQGQGSPVDIKTGDNVRLGQVEFTALSAEALREFAIEKER